jgi:hypothetical protein
MIILSLFISAAMAASDLGPAAFPVFLREGFSSILEFDETPTQVVLGDQNLFQIEKLKSSLLIKPLKPYATTNMFVYFKSAPTKLFILTASEDSEPVYFKKISTSVATKSAATNTKTAVVPAPSQKLKRGASLRRTQIDSKKDYLTVDFTISADSTASLIPNWDLVRLKVKDRILIPSKLWSERREVQRDTSIKARLIFTKPSLGAELKNAVGVIPLKNSTDTLTFALEGSVR